MNKRPGHVEVTTEVGYCSFCSRARNLRSEEHHLGTLVRTIVTCETCHRTLSSSVGVAQAEPAAEKPAEVAPPSAETGPAKPKRASARTAAAEGSTRKPAAKKATAPARPAAAKPAAAARAGKPASTSTRKVAKKK